MFTKDFVWGTATASYQIEGAAYEDGRTDSVWDVFSRTEGNVKNFHNGDYACDHYHRYKEDVKLMAELGVNAYRFSISWSRILPNGTGEVNQKGIEFYNNLIDELLKYNITPYITLFHWDYPHILDRKGGWRNNDSPKWFEEYARVVYNAFSDRVKNFITFNEPQCFIGGGYQTGVHAPGYKLSRGEIVQMSHNVLKAHGLAVRALREIAPDCKVGYAPCGSAAIPLTESKEDIEAARKKYFALDPENFNWCVCWWSDPIMLGHYPEDDPNFKLYSKYLPENYKEDLELISTPIDFYCQNIYSGFLVKAGESGPEKVPYSINTSYNSLGWPTTPKSLYWGPKFLYERYKKPIVITENGMACHDVVSSDGKVHDPNRIDFIERYLKELKKCAADGTDIKGYFYWSLMDNFEWAHGFTQRFGLVYTDYETFERIPKDSYSYYKEIIAQNGNNL